MPLTEKPNSIRLKKIFELAIRPRCFRQVSRGGLLACMTPEFQSWLGMNIDNWAHGIGLLAGLAIGYLPKLKNDLGFGR